MELLETHLLFFLFFFRIKERGERYFIPLLGIVDILGCLFLAIFHIMDNYDVFNFQSIIACQILSFLQVCIPVISGHSLLLLSIQRYRLVCKPLSKNDFFLETGLIWNCVLFRSLIRHPCWPLQTSLRAGSCK